MTAKVNDVSAEITELACEWPMLEALMAGTSAMRKGQDKYLPKWPLEEDDAYAARVATATLFPAFRRTVSVMSGKPFAKQLTLSEDTPKEIAGVKADPKDPSVKAVPGWADDIDREGVSIHVFAAEMFDEAVAYGLAGILVDAPPAVATANPQPTVADQKAAGVRPYFVRIKHSQILGWKTTSVNGARVLTQFRFMECVKEDDGDFGTVDVEQVRVLEIGKWTTYRRPDGKPDKDFEAYQNGTTGLDVIPFAPIYGQRTGYMVGRPPLLDLAYMNVEHWQSKSDQQTILHVARVPILFAKGFQQDADGGTGLAIGSSSAVMAPSENADLKWVEHQGHAIGAGQGSLTHLEQQMVQTGAELVVNQITGQKTATEDANDAEGNKSDLQRIAENFEDSVNLALSFLAKYASLATGGKASLFKDFGFATLSLASATLIKDLMVGGKLSLATGLTELQRRGELDSELDIEAEQERIDAEGPALATMLPPSRTPPKSPPPPPPPPKSGA